MRLHVSGYLWHHRRFSMTMKTNPAYTHFCFLSDSVCVRESLPLSSFNKGLISASVEYVNPFGGPLALSPCPRDPHCPALPFPSRGKGGSGITSVEAWWARTSSPGWLCVAQRRGRRRGAPHNPIDHPCPIWRTHWPLQWYSQWSGRASLPLQSGHIFTKLDSSHSHVGSLVQKRRGIIC